MKKKLVLILVVVGFIVGPVWAVPTWDRYVGDPALDIHTPGTTFQEWYFDTDATTATPEEFYNPYGVVEAVITHAGTSGDDPVWSNGVWSGRSIKFTVNIPNTNNTAPDSYKDVIVEIGFKGNISLANVTVGDIAIAMLYRETSFDGEWTIVKDYYHIEPNPTSEDLCLGFSVFTGNQVQYLDYIKVDTICAVPVPGAILLGGIGAGLVGWFRRKTL